MTYSQAFIDKHREFNVGHDWWDSTYDNFNHICEILGIDLDKNEPSFSGFWSQGDGASWIGSYSAIAATRGIVVMTYDLAPQRIREYAPKDEELHRIADELCLLSRTAFPAYAVIGRQNSRYVHSNTMCADTLELCVGDEWYDGYDEESGVAEEVVDHIRDQLQDLFRALADWLYSTLEKEHEYLTSDEAVIESLEANEIEEDEDL
jgi:hypothetical protein